MRRFLSAALALCLACGLVACSSTSTTTTSTTTTTEAATTDETYTLRVGLVLDETNPHSIALTTVFKPYVEEQSGGKITVEVYPNSALGDDTATVNNVALGALEMSAPSASVLPNIDENYSILDVPYLFDSVESARAALDGELGDALTESLAEKGILMLGFGDSGFRQLTTTDRAVTSPEDMAGLSIRVMENALHIDAFTAFGANPTPMSFSELFTALQQGTVDGQDNSIIVTASSKFYEVQNYMTLTEHIYGINCYLISKELFESMPEEYQTIIQDGVDLAKITHRELVDEQEAGYLETIEAAGVEVTVLTDDQKAAFMEAVAPVQDAYIAEYGSELYDLAVMYNK